MLPCFGFCPTSPTPQQMPVLGQFAVGCSSPGWVLTRPACGRTQPPPHPAPQRLRRARSHWRRSVAGGQPTGQSMSPSAGCSVPGGSSPPPTRDGVCRIPPIRESGTGSLCSPRRCCDQGNSSSAAARGGRGPAPEGFGPSGHQPQDTSPTSAPTPSPRPGEGRPEVSLPPAHKTGRFQVVSKSPSGEIPQRRKGMGRDGPEDAAGWARTVPRPPGCRSRALPVPGPTRRSPAAVPVQAAPPCQAPPVRGGPRGLHRSFASNNGPTVRAINPANS